MWSYIDTLGTVRVRCASTLDAQRLPSQAKRFGLLVYLAVDQPGLPVQRELLLGLFWPDLGPGYAHRALRQTLYQLRHVLGPGVITSQGTTGLALACDRVDCDASRLKTALRRQRLRTAVSLYRGDFLPGFHVAGCPEFERWMEAERESLRAGAAAAACSLAYRNANADQTDLALHYARRAVDIRPYSETCWRCLIQLLAAHGDEAAAVLAYTRMSHLLSEDLGLSPSEKSQALMHELGAEPVTAD